MNISFVVLHYENIVDTRECIESLMQYMHKEDEVHIIIVDNGSIKGKANVIEKEVKNKNIHYIYSPQNLGFARGNNLGFYYAKYTLHSEIIVLSNNDILYKQPDFVERIKKDIAEQYIDVAGPRIMSMVDHKNQNPVTYLFPDITSVNKRMLKFKVLRGFCYFGLDKMVQKLFAKKHELKDCENIEYQLHGACLILANNYIKKYDGLYPKTFMYMEEGILKYIVKKNGFNMKYLDDIEVFHKEGSSTEKIYGAGRKKRLFYYKWNINGCKVLKELMESGEALQ